MKWTKLAKKLLSVALCAAMVGSCAAVVPSVTQGGRIVASAVEATPASSFSYYENDGEIVINGFKGTETVVVIPSTIDGKPVTSIRWQAFKDCTSLEQISIPASVISIKNNAFSGCANLKEVFLSEGLMWIADEAFKDCTSLEQISIPSSVTKIDDNAFSGCTSLNEVFLS